MCPKEINSMPKKVGLLTAGSDSPGINAAIRGFGKAAANTFDLQVIGFRDGFEGLVNDITFDLSGSALSGLLTLGGTILGTSRAVPAAMPVNDVPTDRMQAALDVYRAHELEALVCIGGKETLAAALSLKQAGVNVIVMPKAADNDMPGTDLTIGFDTAREIATEAIDRLHSTANATHRIMIVELLGANSGWLTLSAGMAAGADVILIPEIPYDTAKISQAILARSHSGKNFSIVAVAESARSSDLVAFLERSRKMNEKLRQGEARIEVESQLEKIRKQYAGQTLLLASRLEEATKLTSRITILGALVRGGAPTAADRLLATQMAEYTARMVAERSFGCMVCHSNGKLGSKPLEELAGKTKPIPLDHPWLTSARQVGTCLGM
jgi:6-phosphofructokinase